MSNTLTIADYVSRPSTEKPSTSHALVLATFFFSLLTHALAFGFLLTQTPVTRLNLLALNPAPQMHFTLAYQPSHAITNNLDQEPITETSTSVNDTEKKIPIEESVSPITTPAPVATDEPKPVASSKTIEKTIAPEPDNRVAKEASTTNETTAIVEEGAVATHKNEHSHKELQEPDLLTNVYPESFIESAMREATATELAALDLQALLSAEAKYPALAERRGIEGIVTLIIQYDNAGEVRSIAVGSSSGSAILDRAALATAEKALKAQRNKALAGQTTEIKLVYQLSNSI